MGFDRSHQCGIGMPRTIEDERTIDEKGRVTIPKAAREALGLEPGADVRIGVEDDRIVV